MQFDWRKGTGFAGSIDAQTAGEHLEALREQAGEEGLTPDLIVADARNPESPLHAAFTWDVQKAAKARWRDEARQLVRAIVRKPESNDERERPIRAFISISDGWRRRYEPVDQVVTHQQMRSLMLSEAIKQFMALKRRYVHLAEFSELFAVVEDLAAAVSAK